MVLYHLVEKDQWEESRDADFYAPPSLESDGFIHCSSADQVIPAANRFYAGSTSLLLLVIDMEEVPSEIAFEDLRGGGTKFPHIYGKVPLTAVEAVIPLKPAEDGRFASLPQEALRETGPAKLYHLVHKNAWEESKDADSYAPPSLEGEGFIHCSTANQVVAAANRFYAGSESLLLIVIDPQKVPAKVAFEDLHGGGVKYPHVYGKLPLTAVETVVPLEPNDDGQFTTLPPEAL